MIVEPEYGENIVVFVKYENHFAWYVSDKTYWVLDYPKWQAIFDSELDFEEPIRYGIPVLNSTSWIVFAERMKEFLASKSELNQLIISNLPIETWDSSSHLFPSLFIDFDAKRLKSLYPEYLTFEAYLPEDWDGEYVDFINNIPVDEKYWIINGIDYFPTE